SYYRAAYPVCTGYGVRANCHHLARRERYVARLPGLARSPRRSMAPPKVHAHDPTRPPEKRRGSEEVAAPRGEDDDLDPHVRRNRDGRHGGSSDPGQVEHHVVDGEGPAPALVGHLLLHDRVDGNLGEDLGQPETATEG